MDWRLVEGRELLLGQEGHGREVLLGELLLAHLEETEVWLCVVREWLLVLQQLLQD